MDFSITEMTDIMLALEHYKRYLGRIYGKQPTRDDIKYDYNATERLIARISQETKVKRISKPAFLQ